MDGMITVSEICKLMHISRPTLYKRVSKTPHFPQPFQFVPNGTLYFWLEDVTNYLKRFRQCED